MVIDEKSNSSLADKSHRYSFLRRPVRSAVDAFHRVDLSSHGYIPFLLWLCLFFGGIWFPATTLLKYYFEGGPAPQTVLVPVMPVTGIVSFFYTIFCLGACVLFWSWTNLALLCVMSSTMGEINRTRASRRQGISPEDAAPPEYRIACTRAFVVYLLALVNGITFGGSLVTPGAGSDIQGTYIRVAVMACIASFIASYRPEFFDSLLSRFAATGEQQESTSRTTVVAISSESKSTSSHVPAAHLSDDEAAPVLNRQFSSP
jgi:hypothetical protein